MRSALPLTRRSTLRGRWHWRLAAAASLCSFLSAALLLTLSSLPVRAADPPAEQKSEKVQIKHADKLFYDAARKIYHLTGNIVMVQKDVTITMDQCDYDDNNNSAVATGHLKMVDPESTLTGDALKIAFDPKFAQIIGNVTIVTQKKKEEQPAEGDKKGLTEYRQKKTTITCPQIDYYYADDKKQATVFGPVKAVQEDKTVYADKALYDGLKEEVVLDGNVRLLLENGSEFRCPQATISLNDDWIEARDIEGVAVEESKPEPPPAPPPPAENGGEAIPAAENGG